MGYDPGSDNGAEQWRDVYWSFGQNLVDMMTKAQAEQRWDILGVGYALKAWGWQVLTDIHGEIIVKEAFNPTRSTTTTTRRSSRIRRCTACSTARSSICSTRTAPWTRRISAEATDLQWRPHEVAEVRVRLARAKPEPFLEQGDVQTGGRDLRGRQVACQ